MFEKKIEALLISKRLITNSPRITDQNRCKFHSAALNAFKRSKSALNSLKSDFTVFSRKPSLNVLELLTNFKSYCQERNYGLQSRLTLS